MQDLIDQLKEVTATLEASVIAYYDSGDKLPHAPKKAIREGGQTLKVIGQGLRDQVQADFKAKEEAKKANKTSKE